MKRGYLIGAFLGTMALSANSCAAEALPPFISISPKGPLVSLSADDSVEVAPDIALIPVNLTTRNRDRALAVTASDDRLAKIKSALMGKGVAATEIEQGYFTAREEFEGEGNSRRRKGFVVEHNLTIKLHKLDNLGDVMWAAIGAGATNIDNPAFEVENKAPILEKLIASATARAKAMIHAKLNGFSAVRLLSITDTDGVPFRLANRPARVTMEEAGTSPDLAPRPVSISVSLAMAFELTN